MAQTTLPAPRPQVAPRRRAFFGLFDADGWGWASAKAIFWFVTIIMLLGYLPDRAYYFTVQRTVDGEPGPGRDPHRPAASPGAPRRVGPLLLGRAQRRGRVVGGGAHHAVQGLHHASVRAGSRSATSCGLSWRSRTIACRACDFTVLTEQPSTAAVCASVRSSR